MSKYLIGFAVGLLVGSAIPTAAYFIAPSDSSICSMTYLSTINTLKVCQYQLAKSNI